MPSAQGKTPPAVRGLQALLTVTVLAFVASTVPGVRAQAGFDPLIDGWLQGTVYVLAAALAVTRPLVADACRAAWMCVAAALVLRALAFVVFLAVVREMDPIPYPSAADAGWIASALLFFVALLFVAGDSRRRVSTRLALDGVVGGLAVAALAVALFHGTLDGLTAPETPTAAVVTNLAYPILDVMLLLTVVGLMAVFAWRPTPAMLVLAGGLAAFAVIDGVFLYQVTAGTFRPGTPLSALSAAATAAIAAAGWMSHTTPTESQGSVATDVLVPGAFALACTGLLVSATQSAVPDAAVALATGGLVVAVVRTALTFRDVRGIAEARTQARTDDLTTLPNRRAFNERMAWALRDRDPGRPLSLLILDIDDFKDVNDTLGHHRGDELLAMVAPRLQVVLRADDLLARIGGDEFAVVLDGAPLARALDVADRLRGTLKRPLAIGGHELTVGASVGIAVFPDHGGDAEELLRNADAAMYGAKGSPGGYAAFSPAHHVSSRKRLESAERLGRAIAEGELVLHYQPQVDLATGATVGVEALVRWQHPDLGLLGPGEFLPQAESGGLMHRLSLDVVDQAARQARAWRAQGMAVPVSVNLSVTNLLDLGFPGQFAAVLRRHGLPGDALVLELTEDLFMADPARGRQVMRSLVEIGTQIVVDDYGTGYSSLGYLRDLRDIAGLKLDRSFVTHLDEDPRAAAIVESTVALTQALGLRLVAEGVETEAVRDRLIALGCRHAQGFLFARPVPAAEIDV